MKVHGIIKCGSFLQVKILKYTLNKTFKVKEKIFVRPLKTPQPVVSSGI